MTPRPQPEYLVDILKFDKKIERYVEDFATFSKREREETVEEIHDILMACSRPHTPASSEREKVLDDLRWRVTTVGFEPKDEAAFLYLIDYVKEHPDEVDYLAELRQGEQE